MTIYVNKMGADMHDNMIDSLAYSIDGLYQASASTSTSSTWDSETNITQNIKDAIALLSEDGFNTYDNPWQGTPMKINAGTTLDDTDSFFHRTQLQPKPKSRYPKRFRITSNY